MLPRSRRRPEAPTSSLLRRYWFEFDIPPLEHHGPEPAACLFLLLGSGVTAFSYGDALDVLRGDLFRDDPMPPVHRVVRDVDIRTLDRGHVRPNMLTPNWRGIWYPWGFRR